MGARAVLGDGSVADALTAWRFREHLSGGGNGRGEVRTRSSARQRTQASSAQTVGETAGVREPSAGTVEVLNERARERARRLLAK